MSLLNKHSFVRYGTHQKDFPEPYLKVESEYMPILKRNEPSQQFITNPNLFSSDFADLVWLFINTQTKQGYSAKLAYTKITIPATTDYAMRQTINVDTSIPEGAYKCLFGFNDNVMLTPDFSSDTNWIKTGTAAITGGNLVFAPVAGVQRLADPSFADPLEWSTSGSAVVAAGQLDIEDSTGEATANFSYDGSGKIRINATFTLSGITDFELEIWEVGGSRLDARLLSSGASGTNLYVVIPDGASGDLYVKIRATPTAGQKLEVMSIEINEIDMIGTASQDFEVFSSYQKLLVTKTPTGSPTGLLEVLSGSTVLESFNLVTMPSPSFMNLPAGEYTMRFTGTTDIGQQILVDSVAVPNYQYESNCLYFTEDDEILSQTALLNYRNASNIYHNIYEHDSTENQIRLHINRTDEQYPDEVEQYKEATTGKPRNYNHNAERELTFETYYFDDLANQAMASTLQHATFKINGIALTPKEGYSIQRNQFMNRNKGNFKALDTDYAGLNKNGRQVV